MAFFSKEGKVIEVTNPEINPQLTSGATRLSATNLNTAREEAAGISTKETGVSIDLPTRDSVPRRGRPEVFTEETGEEIRERERQRIQGQLDLITGTFTKRLEGQREEQKGKEARGKALTISGGTIGTPFASARAQKIEDIGGKERELILQEKAVAIQEIFDRADERADEKIEAERTRLTGEEETFFEQIEAFQTQAREDIATLGLAGVDVGLLKKEAPERYQQLLEDSGLSDLEFEALVLANDPDVAETDLQFKELKTGAVGFFNPKTGDFTEFEIEGGLEIDEELRIIDGIPYASSVDEDGNIKLRKVAGFTPKPKDTKPDVTEARFIRDLRKEATDISKNFRETRRQFGLMQVGLAQAEEVFDEGRELGTIEKDDITGGLSFSAESLNAPSQAILVTFQKILDPTSVVRESEYARSSAGESAIRAIQGKIQGITKGGAGVTLEGLREIVDLAEEFLNNSIESMKDDITPIIQQVDDLGFDREQVFSSSVLGILDEGTVGELDIESVDAFLDEIP